jgi:DNA polymerase III epsilon subunit-like protein
MKILVLDTETTGLNILKHEVIQIGFLNIELEDDNTYKILSKEQINIKPKRLELAEKRALEINGFSKKKWRGSKEFQVHAEKIRQEIESAKYLLGQNLIFDLRFIKQEFENAGLKPPKFPKYIDTKNMAAPLLREGKLKSASMDKMCEHFQIKFEGEAHTALTDCERTLSVWSKLVEQEGVKVEHFSFKKPFDPYKKKEKQEKTD